MIQSMLDGRSLESLSGDRHSRLALERLFEIVCEASRHIPDEIRSRESLIDWRRMTDLGNLLRHAYHRVDVSRLISMAHADLPPLKAFAERVLDEESKR